MPQSKEEKDNLIVRLWFVSMENGGLYQTDLWELENKLAS